MGARLSQVRRLAGVAFMTALAASCTAAAGGPYLPNLGPIPLRFAANTASPAAASPVAPPDSASAGNSDVSSTAATHETALTTATNTVADIPVAENPATDSSGAGKAPVSYVFAPPVVGLTPQVLTEYFQPVAGRTNASATALLVPVDVSFTPPVPKAEAASRATYKIQ